MIMKKSMLSGRASSLFATLILSLALLVPVYAQDGAVADQAIEIVREGIPHDALYAIDMSGETGLAVGAFGLMLETSDGGGSWTLVPPKTPLALLGITRAGDKQIVVGQQGFVMTRAGADDWEIIDSGFQQRMLNVDMNEAGLAMAVGEFGFLAVSNDAGHTWKSITIDWEQYNEEGYEPHLYEAIVRKDGSILFAGEFGLIFRTTDQGETIEEVNSGDESVFAMHMAKDGSNSGYAVGQEGLLLKTGDSGNTWQRIATGTKSNLLGVWSGNSEVVVAGIRQLLRSSDDGASFSVTHDTQIIRTWFQDVAAGVTETQAGEKGFLRQQSIYVVGHRATIARVLK